MTLIVAINWRLAFTVLPCMLLLYVIRRTFMNAQRHGVRLLKVAESPVLGHLSNSIDGVHTILAFGADEHLSEEFGLHYDTMIASWYTTLATFVWFQLHCNLTGCLLNVCMIATCFFGADCKIDFIQIQSNTLQQTSLVFQISAQPPSVSPLPCVFP